jgi:hypothetical protein
LERQDATLKEVARWLQRPIAEPRHLCRSLSSQSV